MERMLLPFMMLPAFGVFFIKKRFQFYSIFTAQAVLIAISSFVAFETFRTEVPFTLKVFDLLGSEVKIVADTLSAFFILVINLTVFTGTLYAKGYLSAYFNQKTRTEIAWHYFNLFWMHFSMLAAVMLREGLSFLVMWELMSVSAFFLIIFDSDNQEVKNAGIKFLIQMHIALVLLLSGFLISSLATAQPMGFESLTAYFRQFPEFPLFLLFFAGFGIKAGFIPLHSWLPHAHPAAPSPVSGIMSGVMIKMGIYGILRVLTYVQHDFYSVGLLILTVSVLSGILGVILAIVQHDVKKLLAYHSIENIGIIGIGIGFGTLGLATQNEVLATLGFAGGLLHVLNHSLFKSLLFYSIGNVYQQTHTRNIERLGGLFRKMPLTAIFFLLGALAISGLPPFNGFISEFLIYSGLFKSLSINTLLFSFIILGGIVSLVIIGGLAVYCFTKVFGIVFLGNERSKHTHHAKEVQKGMFLPMVIIGILILVIGFLPFLTLEPLGKILSVFMPGNPVLESMEPTMKGLSKSLGAFAMIAAFVWWLKVKLTKGRQKSQEPTWGCGYTGADPAVHQYTATSYAEYIADKTKILSGVKKHYVPIGKDNIFPEPRKFSTHGTDVFEDSLIRKPVNKMLAFMERIAVLQSGNIQDYLLYGILFILFIVVLSILKII
ncbi:MAG: hydrogenase [Bacteroidales bacterium]|nr:hydrogenase [Bacteroidales bacterium]